MSSLEGLRLVGPELVLGKVFDEIFSKVSTPFFRTLVLRRISYPGSKLKTVEYLNRIRGEVISVDSIYRFMDKYHKKQMEAVQQASYCHGLGFAQRATWSLSEPLPPPKTIAPQTQKQ